VPPGSVRAVTFQDFAQPAWQFVAVIFFLVPGLNCTWAIERIAGRTLLGNTERLIRALAWSAFVYVLASPWLVSIARRIHSPPSVGTTELVLAGFLVILVIPFIVGVVAALLRRSVPVQAGLRRLTTISPSPTAWDFAFSRDRPYYVRVSLVGGRRLAGSFGNESVAGSFPQPQDLFLEQAWELDTDGVLVGPVAESAGILVRQETIEFVEWLSLNAGGRDGQATKEES